MENLLKGMENRFIDFGKPFFWKCHALILNIFEFLFHPFSDMAKKYPFRITSETGLADLTERTQKHFL